ncbi:transcription factor [Hysterangium stoloniferum]|nr:transcription factor [Hysterangium stoloniferum]
MAANQTRPPPGIKIYNAVYSSVQVYECMIRGIAVMRRRADSYVNATQILKVAGIDKGRRTKILEKEILPGKHEIVQGGYGKYQGTWSVNASYAVCNDCGRDVAAQFGVAHLLTPLFDYMPSASNLTSFPTLPALAPARPPSGSPAYHPPYVGYYPNQQSPQHTQQPNQLAPPAILPGSALKLLNQGRAQGLFTPSSSNFNPYAHRSSPHASPGAPQAGLTQLQPPAPLAGSNHITSPALKRPRSSDIRRPNSAQGMATDMRDPSPRPRSAINGERDGFPSPSKRARLEPGSPSKMNGSQFNREVTLNGLAQAQSDAMAVDDPETHLTRMADKPSSSGSTNSDKLAPLHNTKRTAILSAIHKQATDPHTILNLLITNRDLSSGPFPDMDVVLDDQGHTPLHLAASLARDNLVQLLVQNGANPCTGNFAGETPLMRTVLSMHSFQSQLFPSLVSLLHTSIRTLDGSRSSVLHHIAHIAGVKGRAAAARYYMEGVLMWIAEHQDGDFKSLVDIQNIHGDTALNIAARVGNRSLVKTLIDCGANRTLANKLGLRPGDFGLEADASIDPSQPMRADDFLAQLRSAPSIPVQKSKDVIADMTSMISGLSTEFQTEIKTKQEGLASIQAKLRASTRVLAEQRRQIQTWQSKCGELDQVRQRIRNLERALQDEDNVDWTGRSTMEGEEPTKGAFVYRGAESTLSGVGFDDLATNPFEFEPPIPEENTREHLVKMRRMQMWHRRTEQMMEARLKQLQGASADKEFQCKKIVSLCTGVPMDQVEQMLENLVIAVESEAQVVDLGRVAGFMQKVRDGII